MGDWLSGIIKPVLTIGGGVVGGIFGGPAGAMIGSGIGGMVGSAFDGSAGGKGPGTSKVTATGGHPGDYAYNGFQPQAATIGMNPDGNYMNIPGTRQFDPSQGAERLTYKPSQAFAPPRAPAPGNGNFWGLNTMAQQIMSGLQAHPQTGGLPMGGPPRLPGGSPTQNATPINDTFGAPPGNPLYGQFYGGPGNTGGGGFAQGGQVEPVKAWSGMQVLPTSGGQMIPGSGTGGNTGAPTGAPVFNAPQSSFNATANIDPNYINSAPQTATNYSGAVDSQSYTAPQSRYNMQPAQNAYQAQQANIATSNYQPVIGQSGGQASGFGGPAQGTIGQMGQLGGTLQNEMMGGGPSLAQWQLQNATQQNANSAASAINSQKGINSGMAARQIAGQEAGANQNAANQSAGLRLQEQLAAQQQLASVLNAQGGLQIGQQQAGTQAMGVAGGLQNQQGANQIQNAGMAQGINAQTAGQNAGFQQQAGLANQQNTQFNAGLQGQNNQLNANIGLANQASQNFGTGLNQQSALANLGAQQQTNALNQQIGLSNLQSQNYAMGLNQQTSFQNSGMQLATNQLNQSTAISQAQLQQQYQQMMANIAAQNAELGMQAQGINSGVGMFNAGVSNQNQNGLFGMLSSGLGAMGSFGGGSSGGGGSFSGSAPMGNGAPFFASGGLINGGQVPGQAQVGGDSPRNDTVPADLSPGEIVIPRSVAQSPNAPQAAAQFVQQVKRRGYSGGGPVQPASYEQVVAQQRALEKRKQAFQMLTEAKNEHRKACYGGTIK